MKRSTTHQGADRGFTLPELLICVVVIGVIATVLVGVTAVVLRSTPSAEARSEDARSMMGLVTWLPQDVDSTPPTGFDTASTTASGCNLSPGTNLLRMQWTEKTSATVNTFVANYRHVPTAGGLSRIQRVTCSGTGSGPFTNGVAINLTSDLPALPAGWAPGNPPVAVTMSTLDGSVRLVTFEITTLDGEIVKTDSAPKNPAMTLPSTTAPSWRPPTPSTAVEVNNLPTADNRAFTIYPGLTTTVNLAVSDIDGDPLVVELASFPSGWSVSLSSVTMQITAPSGTPFDVPNDITYTVDDQRGDGAVTGTLTVTPVDPVVATTTTSTTSTTTTTTTTTTIAPTCVVTGHSISPSTVKNVQPDSQNQGGGNVNVGVLRDPVTVTATSNAYCAGLQIEYSSGGVNSPPFRAMTQTSPTTWTLTLEGRDQGTSETWSDGDHILSFHSANGGSWGTATLKVT
jgi:prepilin-type N-terminal cleavage/methylation domain-containing protein